MFEELEAAVTLKSYKGPWMKRGPLLLACGKCQRKLKHEPGDDVRALARLKKSLRKRSRKTNAGIKLQLAKDLMPEGLSTQRGSRRDAGTGSPGSVFNPAFAKRYRPAAGAVRGGDERPEPLTRIKESVSRWPCCGIDHKTSA